MGVRSGESAIPRHLDRGSAAIARFDSERNAESIAPRSTLIEFEAARRWPAAPAAQNADRFTRLFEANVVSILLCDENGHVTEANDAFLDMLGHKRDDLPMRWDQLSPPECSSLDAAKFEELMSTGAGVAWETEYLARDGHRVPVLVAVTFLNASRGKCVAIVHDLSERVRLEAALRESEATCRTLYEVIQAIRAVVGREEYLSSAGAAPVVEAMKKGRSQANLSVFVILTDRERAVLQLLAEGHSSKEIAALLHVSTKTVGTHREHVMGKLDIHSIAGLTKYAIREGLTSVTD